jgi:heme o synthase
MISEYYWLMKPGIIYGNIITAVGGFFLAAKGHIDLQLFFVAIFGLAFVIGSACVFNNYIDRDIDLMMARTKNRGLATRTIPVWNAMIFATLLLGLGFYLLWFFTNPVASLLAFIGFFVYVFVYTFLKRRTVYATLIGSISGATPIVVGYCAVTGQFDLAAAILFIVLATWQMPHFFAIAIYRLDDYAKAGIPVLPIKRGLFVTKINILCYIIGFLIATIFLFLFDYTGLIYLAVMLILGGYWVWLGAKGFDATDDQQWARGMFKYSLIVLLIFSVMISIHVV